MKWSLAHDELRVAMQKELAILRELLSNLFQEEFFLNQGAAQGIRQILQDRSELRKALETTRKERLLVTTGLKKSLKVQSKGKKLELCFLLPDEDENSSEILSLREQKRTLLYKLHDQKMRNSHLSREGKILPKTQSAQRKKKSAVATYPNEP